jgi:hypothetical protein
MKLTENQRALTSKKTFKLYLGTRFSLARFNMRMQKEFKKLINKEINKMGKITKYKNREKKLTQDLKN